MSFQFGPKNPRPGPKWLQVPSFRPAAVAAVAISGGEKCWNSGKLEGNISSKYRWVTKTEKDSYSMDGYFLCKSVWNSENSTIVVNRCFGWTDVGSKTFFHAQKTNVSRDVCVKAMQIGCWSKLFASRRELKSTVLWKHTTCNRRDKNISCVCIFWCTISNLYQMSIKC